MELGFLGRYELRGELGRGTMGVVYRGFDPVLEREVALKTVRLSPALPDGQREKFLARFFREAKIAAKLLHPNIVVTHDAATEGGVPFIAMELVSGGSLRERVAKGPLGWREAIELVVPIAAALDYAHEEGIVHRDVKPANVLMTKGGVPKLADFGIARLPSSEITESGALVGTPQYMSPEQLESDAIDGRSDVFALGALCYALLVGRPPFGGTDIATITQHILYKDPTPVSELVDDVPAGLDGVLARALAKRRDERYQRASGLAEDLLRVSRGEAPQGAMPLGERTLESVPRPERPVAAEPFAASEPPPADTAEAASKPSSSSSSRIELAVFGAAFVLVAALGWDAVPRGVRGVLDDYREAAARESQAEEGSRRLETARELSDRGHFPRAREEVEEALAIFRAARNGEGEARGLLLRGRIHAAEGRWSEARSDLDAAVAVFSIYGRPRAAAAARVAFADVERDRGAFERAEALYARALSEGAGSEARVGRALLLMMRGEHDEAREALASVPPGDPMKARASLYLWALDCAESKAEAAERDWLLAAERMDAAEIAMWRGYASLATGREDEEGAEALFRQALTSFASRGHRTGLSAATEGLAGRKRDSVLGTIFLALPRTARTEALTARF